MKNLGYIFLAWSGIMATLLAGCSMGLTRVEADFGNSANFARVQQILDPAAQKNLEPVAGFDGQAAEATLDRYRTTFEKPAPPPAFVLTVGPAR